MFIHLHKCIAPIKTDEIIDWRFLPTAVNGKLKAVEPNMDEVPPAMLRRMSKAVKMGIVSGLPILKNNNIDGIIIGTANGGMQDCIHFLNQIVDYNEGLLTPGNFVQSTPNAIAGQLSMLTKNNHYNATHVHNGLAFENALLDAQLWLSEKTTAQYLVGGVDEISGYNYNIDRLAGWFSTDIENKNLFSQPHAATIAGEGAAMFLVNNQPQNAIAKVKAIKTLHTNEEQLLATAFEELIEAQNINIKETLLISGYNGDTRQKKYHTACKNILPNTPLVYFKHLTGEFPTATAFAVWLACYCLNNSLTENFLEIENKISTDIKNVVIYNSYHGTQHSFIYLTKK